MIVDKELEFADNQALTAAAASDAVVDLEQVSPTPGMSKQLVATFTVAEDVAGTLQFKLQDSDNGSDWDDLATSAVLTAPVAGTTFSVPLPFATKRYIRAYFDGAPTAGKVNALLSNSHYGWKAIKQADTVTNGLTNSRG